MIFNRSIKNVKNNRPASSFEDFMVKFKRYSSIFLFTIALSAIVYGYIWFRSRNAGVSDSRIAVPECTVAFIEFNNIAELINEIDSGNNILSELQKIKQFSKYKSGLYKLDSVLNKNFQIKKLFSNKLTISVCQRSNRTPGILFIFPLTEENQSEMILDFFRKNTRNFKSAKRRFESVNIYDLSWSDQGVKVNFTFTLIKGLFVGSFAGDLVEESVLHVRSGRKLSDHPEFNQVTETTGEKVSANLFINYQMLPGLINHLSSGKKKFKTYSFSNFADWGEFDTEIFSDCIVLNGFTSINDTLFRELRLFKAQDPIEFSSPSFLPAFVNFFKIYGFTDSDLFFKKITEKFESDVLLKELSDLKSNLISKYQIDLTKSVKELISNEYGIAFLAEGKLKHEYFFIKLKSQSIAEEVFRNWIMVYAQKNGLKNNELLYNAKIDNNTSIPVFNLPVGGIPRLVFGKEFELVNKDYFSFINNYIVFSNSRESLKHFMYQVILGNTISTDPSFTELKDHISSLSNCFMFIRPYQSFEQLSPFLNDKFTETIRKSRERFGKFNAVMIQYSAADKLFYSHVFINYSRQINDNVKTVWESRLDTLINMKPAIMINHNTGEKEIFIQDCSNQIYLLSNAGLILWKQRLNGQILGDIFQVDYYGNNKLQYLFNTTDKVYLIDRNGNPVEKYPINLRSKASAGMSVFDYNKDGVLRICIPCEDRNIYMYDKEGRVIPGWKPGKTDNIVTRPVQHFRVGDRDYIIAIDRFKFYIMDRKGNTRIKPSTFFPVSVNNSFYLDYARKNSAAGFITTDTSGNIMKVSLNGKIEKVIEQKLHPDHFFVLTDLNGDRVNDYVIVSGNEFLLLNHRGNKLFSQELQERIEIKPLIYNFSATDNKIGIVMNHEGIIYLFNNDGSIYEGFPLEGVCPFSISSFPEQKGKFNLIVGGTNNFLYNYFVQ